MKRFAQLFSGRTDCFGRYILPPGSVRQDGKKKGRGSTVREELLPSHYEQHLDGKIRLGLVPIRLDGKVSWFAGDIDDYSLNLQELGEKVQKLELPLVLCKSKSGGAHLHCFVDGLVPAAEAIKLMRSWVTALGFPKAEVFPKQEKVDEDSVGNWINLPYHNHLDADAYALGLSGERLTLEEFEQLANAYLAKPGDLRPVEQKQQSKRQAKGDLDGAPPCIERIFDEGLSEGGRNNALTHIGIFYLKSDQDNWRDRLTAANYNVFEDPLPIDEVQQIARNVAKSKYEYLCKIEPMCSLCDKDVCLTRKWGVGPQQGIDFADCEIDRIVKINSDPPIYYVIMNGISIKMSTDQLLSPGKFRRRVYEVTGDLIAPKKERAHEKMIQSVRIDVEAAPEEVNQDGQILEAFKEWCEVHIPHAKELAEVLRGNPYFEEAESRIVFRATDVIASFKRQKKFNIADRDVWAALRESGCTRDNMRINNKQTKVWLYPVESVWFDIPGKDAF